MKISEFIKELEQRKSFYGDIEIHSVGYQYADGSGPLMTPTLLTYKTNKSIGGSFSINGSCGDVQVLLILPPERN